MTPSNPAVGGAGAAARIRRVVCDVVRGAVADARAGGVVVLDDWTAGGELTYEWLVEALGEARVWRCASLAGKLEGLAPAVARMVAAAEAVAERDALLAHPATRTELLLGGRIPAADLFPLGDLYASQLAGLTGSWTAPPALEDMVRRAGGVGVIDAMLGRIVAGGGAEPGIESELRRLYERGRWSRLRPRLVPKLGVRTIGIDLFD